MDNVNSTYLIVGIVFVVWPFVMYVGLLCQLEVREQLVRESEKRNVRTLLWAKYWYVEGSPFPFVSRLLLIDYVFRIASDDKDRSYRGWARCKPGWFGYPDPNIETVWDADDSPVLDKE